MRILRINSDLDSPELAVVDRDELFAVRFQSTSEHTGYKVERVEWFRRAPLPTPKPH